MIEILSALLCFVDYIYNYTSDKRYIPFNISVIKLTNKTVDSILKILNNAVNKSKYLNGAAVGELSLYKLEDNPFNKVFSKNNIILIKDVQGIELESVNDKQKYMHLLEEEIEKNKCISLLVCDNETELNNIFTYNRDLKDKYFVFGLKEVKEAKSIIYNEI